MKIWVDADACPGAVRDIIITAAIRRTVMAVFVANKSLWLPESSCLSFIQVNKTPDAADLYIKENARKFDLVVTQDILLAQVLVQLGTSVIDPRGKKFTEDNIGESVSTRNLMQELRDIGEIKGGAKQFGEKEKRAFASSFDQELTRLLRMCPS
jgi:uncharacterized protein YaiI (UPF0178 family)